MESLHFYRGIILTEPYGSFIKTGTKKIIVKSKKFASIVNHDLLLIENKIGLGIIQLAAPYAINLKEFKKLYPKHLITETDRMTWWPSYHILYAYNITTFKKFLKPILLNYPTGPQITVKRENIKPKHILVGTSGYHYDYYKETKHNNHPKTKDILAYYAAHLNSVEINYTFYRKPTENFINNLNKHDLTYIIKVNQTITHYKQLKNIGSIWNEFYHIFDPIIDKIDCFLFQFNTHFIFNKDRFLRFKKLSKLLNTRHKYAFEFRDRSWFNELVYAVIKKYKWIIVITHVNNDDGWAGNLLDGFNPSLSSDIPISGTIYFRLHGTKGQYFGSYSSTHYKKMIDFIKKKNINTALVYFNNTDDGNAWLNANKFYHLFNHLNLQES